jgi:hypothetical protein
MIAALILSNYYWNILDLLQLNLSIDYNKIKSQGDALLAFL